MDGTKKNVFRDVGEKNMKTKIVLASSSKSRRKLLRRVFARFECVHPQVAERLSKPYAKCARKLAEKKAFAHGEEGRALWAYLQQQA